MLLTDNLVVYIIDKIFKSCNKYRQNVEEQCVSNHN